MHFVLRHGLSSFAIDWSRIVINQKILRIVARMSSKVFLGDELCHNERWLQITVNYALVGMRGVGILRMFPYYLRDLVHWFIPACQEARALAKEARELITPVLEKRRAQKANFATEGKKATEFNDAIEWYEQVYKGTYYDAAIAQLTLSLAAIHTTVRNLAVKSVTKTELENMGGGLVKSPLAYE